MVSLLCRGTLGVESYTHITEPLTEIPAGLLPLLQERMSRLLKGEPVQYVMGEAQFCSRSFRVTPDVLIPRPETELLVSMALEYLKPSMSAIDVCTGSGCIAWSLALACPGAAISAADISEPALSLARSQFPDCGIRWIHEDILRPEALDSEGPFDLIVSNPPYIAESEKAQMRRNVLDYEPELALFVDDADPLVFYRALAGICRKHLKDGGLAIMEINERFGAQTAGLFREAGFEKTEIVSDYFGKERFVRIKR